MADDMMFPAAPGALAGLNERQQLLRQQLAQTLALQQRAPMKGYGALGGIGAGLANAARGISGAIVEDRDREELKKNAEEQAAARKAIVDAITGNMPAAAPTRIDPLVAASGHGGFMGVASDMSGPAAATQAAHPIPTGEPVHEPGLAQLAALGIHRPPGAPPAPPAQDVPPVPGGAAPQAQPMSGLEQLAALSQKHQRAALALMASGDPMLTHAGETLMDRARLEQQMGFQGGQADKNRALQAQQIDQGRYDLTMSPYTGAALRLDKRTGEVVPVTQGGAGGTPSAPPLGSRVGDAVARQAQEMREALDPSTWTGPAGQDYQRRQLGQNLQGVIDQMRKDGVTQQLGQTFAADLNKLISGAAGSEGEVKALVQRSAAGDLSKLASWLTGNPQGPEQKGFLDQMQRLLNREHALAEERIRTTQKQRLASFGQFQKSAPQQYQEIVNSFLPPETQAPGSFSLEGHPQDSEAVTWAKAHPDDPRSAKILELSRAR